MAMDDKTKQLLIDLTKRFTQEGKLVEAGWIGFQMALLKGTESPEAVNDLRTAFFGGALHLFQSINAIMDEGQEVTEGDLMTMDRISDELEGFEVKFRRMAGLEDGHG